MLRTRSFDTQCYVQCSCMHTETLPKSYQWYDKILFFLRWLLGDPEHIWVLTFRFKFKHNMLCDTSRLPTTMAIICLITFISPIQIIIVVLESLIVYKRKNSECQQCSVIIFTFPNIYKSVMSCNSIK